MPRPASCTASPQSPPTRTSTSTVASAGSREPDRVAADLGVRTQPPPDLGQAPAERAERIVSLREEQGGQLGPGRRAFGRAAGTPAPPSSCGSGSGTPRRRRPRAAAGPTAGWRAGSPGARVVCSACSLHRAWPRATGPASRVAQNRARSPGPRSRTTTPWTMPNARSRAISDPSQSTSAAAAPGEHPAYGVGHRVQGAGLRARAVLDDPLHTSANRCSRSSAARPVMRLR